MELKQVIVVRTDLKMGKGKIAAQVAHASLGAALKVEENVRKAWMRNAKKVVLKVSSKKSLESIYRKAKRRKLPVFLVRDAGLTQVKPGTVTAVGIGPAESEKIDEVTGKLKLL